MNLSKITIFLNDIVNKIWFIPTVFTLTTSGLSFLLLWIDVSYGASINRMLPWLFTGTVEAASGLLSTIATSLITVISIAFSITILALQQASTQFSPRVLRTFTQSRGNQIVLGMYIATYVYALLTLRTIRTTQLTDDTNQLPSLSISFALLLTLICLGLLIYFIYHISQTLQVSDILRRVHEGLVEQINKMFPEHIAEEVEDPKSAEKLIKEMKRGKNQIIICSDDFGFVREVDKKILADMEPFEAEWVYFKCQIGEFVAKGDPIVIMSNKLKDKKLTDRISESIVINSARSEEQDPLFGIRQLSDIALKALSPGVNDPTTAEYCIFYLADAMKRLATRKFPENKRTFKGQKTVYIFNQPDWKYFMEESFSQIIHQAKSHEHVLNTLAKELESIKVRIPGNGRGNIVDRQLGKVRKYLNN